VEIRDDSRTKAQYQPDEGMRQRCRTSGGKCEIRFQQIVWRNPDFSPFGTRPALPRLVDMTKVVPTGGLIISAGYRFFGEPAISQLLLAGYENSEACTPV
jgi:hypothetical protein